MKSRIAALSLIVLAIAWRAEGQKKPANVPSADAASGTKSSKALPGVFSSALSEIRAKTHVPVLLPSELPTPFDDADHAIVEKATTDEYAVSLYYQLGVGNAGFAAGFSAQGKPGYSPRDLGNTRPVKLADAIDGFFRPVSCGGSCAPANIWWEKNGTVYQFQLRLSSSASEQDQKKTMIELANSAIDAGPQ